MAAHHGTVPTGDGREADLARLLAACARGDKSALRALYDAEAPAMLGVATRLLRRRAVAEDAVHDAFVKIWNGAAGFDPARGNARSWIYAILRHRSLDMLRAQSREELTDTPIDEEEPLPSEDPEAVVARLSDRKALRHCLEQLAPGQRRAVVLAFVHGLTHPELAGRLDVPLGTAKSWVRRGVLSLRECLG